MVVKTVFSDEVVNASELRTNQRHWLETALKRPLTVNYNRKQLAIINREQVRNLFTMAYYAEIIVGACRDVKKGGFAEKFPWIKYLSEDERNEFRDEMLNCFVKSSNSGRWEEMENIISDWEATAEVKASPEILEALKDAGDTSNYANIDE